ncbi:hypothetical protein IFT59_18820 [Rhizobium sp. CFBP 8752]|uniref:hypothetical protein n=1 Tax=Rhizobium sp. CFBP 8752 TaxID=2775301 RepID=UPI001785BF55|nr:hypothetical protein [Rhizobium sp. CFBP 8752]MBD8665297.1 hypothetical protein [Rhizobium sp. CFBP 8752]
MTQSLDYLSFYRWAPFKWEIKRNDQLSGLGSGRTIGAELAPPLWMAQVSALQMRNTIAEEIDAKIRALRGPQDLFMMTSSLFRGPRLDPAGALLGNAAVSVASIVEGGTALALKRLPAGYVLSIGDKVQIQYGGEPERYAFFEFSQAGVASGAGVTPQIPIFPALPAGVAVDMAVTLIKPACRVFVVPESYKVGQVTGGITYGCSFQIMQKK